MAMEELALLQTPPEVISVSAVVAPPAHSVAVPVMAAGGTGSVVTVTIIEVEAVPQPVVTV